MSAVGSRRIVIEGSYKALFFDLSLLALSIRSKCVCWHYRGKEVVRLE
jgi:hypothetical protein